MKKLYLLSFCALCTQLAVASNEIPNPGFETWSLGVPTLWSTSNVPGIATPFIQYTPAHGGAYSLKGRSQFALGDTIPALIQSPSPFSVTQNYKTFDFYYQASLTGGDQLHIFIALYDAGSGTVAGCDTIFTANKSGWTHCSIPLTYSSSNPAATGYISFIVEAPLTSWRLNAYPESYFILDDLSLSAAVGIEEVTSGNKLQVFPLPAHDKVTIHANLDENGPVKLRLQNSIGQILIERNIYTGSLLNYDLDLASIVPGVYYLEIFNEEKGYLRRITVQ